MTAKGTKLGKTEEGAVWLSEEKTSPYHFYQYWLNTTDEDVFSFLKLFTFLSLEEIADLDQSHRENPGSRPAQRALAEELTTLVHGEKKTAEAVRASAVLFGGSLDEVPAATLRTIFSHVPSTDLSSEEVRASPTVVELLVRCKIASSKGAARRLVDGGGLYLNNQKTTDQNAVITTNDFIEGELLVLRSGKKNYHLVQINDESS